jgi:outer membrane protein assembly factor BamB
MAGMGSLHAYDAATGEERWHVELFPTFEAERPKYGLSESVLILGDSLLCCPGGKKGYLVALDRRSGRTLWANTEIRDAVGYCSLVPGKIGGVPQVVGMSASQVFAVNPVDGSLLWQHSFGNDRGNSATDVIIHDNLVFASCGYGKGSVLLRPLRQADGRFSVEQVWITSLLDNHHGGVLREGDSVYGAGQNARGWFCLDFKTGRQRWQAPGKGSLTFADGHLYCLDERGTLSLLRCTPERWEAVSSFRLPRGGRGLYWAHPAVCGGRLYVRHSDQLFAYSLSR